MTYEFILYEKREHIAYITINRPNAMNALHPPANKELAGIWADFRDDPNVWVAIFSGAGERAFCAGNDMKYQAEHFREYQQTGTPWVPLAGMGGISNYYDCYKPIIAAVNGYALGGGFEVVLACDIVVASESASFGFPEPKRGLIPLGGGPHRLARQIPLKLAMGMLLTGRPITATEAYRLGLVNEVVPLTELRSCAEHWAQEILRCAPLAVRAAKEVVLKGLDLPLRIAQNQNYPLRQAIMESEDFKEGPRAFLEKREPRWQGK
jgi:enoyl-CoA hydratase/carnithine racemase